MTRPLPLDVVTFLVPVLLGVGAFLASGPLLRRSRPYKFGLPVVAVLLVAVGVMSVAGVLPLGVDAGLSLVGGSTVVLCGTAMALLGAAWRSPGVSFSPAFLVLLAVIAGFVVVIESGGRLWWRANAPMWARVPDNRGLLRQTSGFTCSPTAAAMMLDRFGVTASEGEMAYRAGTSAFGTDAHSMAGALTDKLREVGRYAVVRRAKYDEMVAAGTPFLAHVRLPGIGNHALFVLSADETGATVFDPADGQRRLVPRAEFEGMWGGTAIVTAMTS